MRGLPPPSELLPSIAVKFSKSGILRGRDVALHLFGEGERLQTMPVRKATLEETRAWLGGGLIIPKKTLTQNPKPPEDDEIQGSGCPYCSSLSQCDHLLLFVDLTFRHAEGGILFDLFNAIWSKVQFNGGDDFNETEEFEAILDVVDGLSHFSRILDQEGGPGMSSTYKIFYTDTLESAEKSTLKFKDIFEGEGNG